VDGGQPIGTERGLSSAPRRHIGFVGARRVAIVRRSQRKEDDMAKKKGKKDKGKKGKKK
jgi:hypothetical protein